MDYTINPYRDKYRKLYNKYKKTIKSEKSNYVKKPLKYETLTSATMNSRNPLSKITKSPDNHFLLGNQSNDASETRKPLLMRRPRGSRRSDVSGHTLYTITSCSEDSQSQAVQSEDESSKVFTRDDFISKPTNFATIVTDSKPEQLPPLSPYKNMHKGTVGNSSNTHNHRSKTTYLPNIRMGSMARKNWINAEVKTFSMWHELSSARTDLKNPVPTQEMIRIEQMLEDMRQQRRSDPSAVNFNGFAEVVKRENNMKHVRHMMSNPRYNTVLDKF